MIRTGTHFAANAESIAHRATLLGTPLGKSCHSSSCFGWFPVVPLKADGRRPDGLAVVTTQHSVYDTYICSG